MRSTENWYAIVLPNEDRQMKVIVVIHFNQLD